MSVRLLPLLATPAPHGSRSRATCTFRCGNACDHPEPNRSGSTAIGEVLATALNRRSVLRAGATGSAAMVLAHPSLAAAATAETAAGARALRFAPVAPNKRDNVTVPPGYDYDLVVA